MVPKQVRFPLHAADDQEPIPVLFQVLSITAHVHGSQPETHGIVFPIITWVFSFCAQIFSLEVFLFCPASYDTEWKPPDIESL